MILKVLMIVAFAAIPVWLLAHIPGATAPENGLAIRLAVGLASLSAIIAGAMVFLPGMGGMGRFRTPLRRGAKTLLVLALCLILLGPGVALAGDKEDIVGRWDRYGGELAYIRFRADGTFIEVAPLLNIEGKYRILEDGVLEIDTPGIFYGRNVVERKYKIDGNTLEVFGTSFMRVK